MFDRSTNNGTTWGTDKTIYTISTDTGPYEPSMAIQPTTGIPGVLFRSADSVGGTCNHYFVKANDMAGKSWKTPIDVTGEAVGACWAVHSMSQATATGLQSGKKIHHYGMRCSHNRLTMALHGHPRSTLMIQARSGMCPWQWMNVKMFT